jgi:hypothetical protein
MPISSAPTATDMTTDLFITLDLKRRFSEIRDPVEIV